MTPASMITQSPDTDAESERLQIKILRYFGDPAAKEPCLACSNCHRRVVIGGGELELVRKFL